MAITQNTYTGDGSTVLFSFTFPYIEESDIKISLDGTSTTAYTFANATTVEFNTAPANGVDIRIYRDTNTDTINATFFPGSAIKAEDLNSNYTQNNYAAQETKRESDTAVSLANSALSIVNSVVSYDPVVNVAAIPAAPSDGDRIEVFDSTGIESFTPLTGVPGGFIGASTLTVRLIYSVTTWAWQDYNPTDPDSRYLKVNGSSTMAGDLVMGTNKITGLVDPTSAQEAATKNYVDTQDDTKLSLSGGTMTGNLVMGTNKITGLLDPTFSQDAATKNYVDNFDVVTDTTPQLGGDLDAQNNKITNLAEPTNVQDAATVNYVDTQDDTKVNLSGDTMTGDLNLPNLVATGDVQLSSQNGGPIAGTRNRIINGDMRIDQRNNGGSVTPATATYTLDRWQATQTTANKFAVQRNAGALTPPPGFTHYLGVTSLSAYSVLASDYYQIKQSIEGFNVADLDWNTAAAKTVTLSFWVRSNTTGNFGVVTSWGSAGANQRAYPVLYTISSANTWEYKTITIPGDSGPVGGGFEVGSEIGIQIRFSLGGGATNAGTPGSWATANSQTVVGDKSVVGINGGTFYITGVQLEVGTVATPFEHKSYGQELALCQRYYQKVDGEYRFDGIYGGGGPTTYSGMWFFPTFMRGLPTLSTVVESGIKATNIGWVAKSTTAALGVWEWQDTAVITTRWKAAVVAAHAEI
ncbi:tail fiber protein [Synechococcus phage S-B28]|uniref:Tail fiber protein n=1 Tax=Synechococcus phage S-B28 TaxID=2545435 RepID=A0A482IC84_9CAUD|nr:tail fiber protein [Synechococcus phage S-B28]QBP05809.1 tail fiber protein [Synechococcus phage S-B28]